MNTKCCDCCHKPFKGRSKLCPVCKKDVEDRIAEIEQVKAEEKARWDALTPEQQQAHRDKEAADRAADRAKRELRRIARKQAGIAQAVATRARRREQHINLIAEKYVAGHRFGPRQQCVICRTFLSDPVSIQRGIGSECWDHMLQWIERTRGGMKLIQGGAGHEPISNKEYTP